MKLETLILSTSLCLGVCATAQTLSFDVVLNDTLPASEVRVFARPLSQPANTAVELVRATGTSSFQGEAENDPFGIYYLYCNTQSAQTSIPVYIPAGNKSVRFGLGLGGFRPSTSLPGPENEAIAAMNSSLTDKSIALGLKVGEMSPEQLSAIFRSYNTEADSLIAAYNLKSPVADFMRLWAYTSAGDAYSLAQYMMRNSGRGLGVGQSDFMPEAQAVLDCEMAAAFPSASSLIIGNLKGNTVEERLDNLMAGYRTESVRDKVADAIIRSFIDRFDYSGDFASGEKRLEAMTVKYNLPETYLNSFRGRRATIPGTPFPDVRLEDAEGNTVDFNSFRGKYVYVDLWASWCVPCCKEVPYLQQLEKDLEGRGIAFVSISTDTARDRWKAKMEQLNMHGNQLIDAEGQLAQKLNIRGIPHFLLYGPDGKLLVYNMTRPSDPATKDALEKLP